MTQHTVQPRKILYLQYFQRLLVWYKLRIIFFNHPICLESIPIVNLCSRIWPIFNFHEISFFYTCFHSQSLNYQPFGNEFTNETRDIYTTNRDNLYMEHEYGFLYFCTILYCFFFFLQICMFYNWIVKCFIYYIHGLLKNKMKHEHSYTNVFFFFMI